MDISNVVADLMRQKKGILSAGETSDVELERMKAFGIESEDAHRAYRELLFTTPGIEAHLSGVLLSEEALGESSGGVPFPKLLRARKIIPGVRFGTVEERAADIQAADEFKKKLTELKAHGVGFGSVVARADVSDAPVSDALETWVDLAARTANIFHEADLVPLIELDISSRGVHSASQAEDTLVDIGALLSDALQKHSIAVPHTIVGVSMATAGADTPAATPPEEVAERTLRAATTALPQDLGGVVFLSDAQTPEEGTANVNALARLEPLPWEIAFCFARALHGPVLEAWKGKEENAAAAQAIFSERLMLLSRADAAGYVGNMEAL